MFAACTEARDQARRPKKADSVAPRLKPFTVSKPEQRELNGLKLCADFVNLKT